MPTSGIYALSVTRDDIVRLAMLTLEKLDEVEVPTAQETTDVSLFLNLLVKQWQGKSDFAPGLKTWTRKHGHLFLSGQTGRYSLGPTSAGWTNDDPFSTTTTATVTAGASVIPVKSVAGLNNGDHFGVVLDSNSSIHWTTVQNIAALNVMVVDAIPTGAQATVGAAVFGYTSGAQQPDVIETAFLRDFQNNDTPIKILLTVQEYDNLPNKASPATYKSDPAAVYYEWHLGTSNLYTDVPASADLTKHIGMTYMEEVQVFTTALDAPEYPAEWFLPLALGTAKLCAPMFHADWTPVMESNLQVALAVAQRKDPANVSRMYFQCGEEP